ncbi:4895_t:CDS:2 [Entrophospora sp. SA101]|nr:4895_t:CDS:2 [Entrophospora sp. SA101]
MYGVFYRKRDSSWKMADFGATYHLKSCLDQDTQVVLDVLLLEYLAKYN